VPDSCRGHAEFIGDGLVALAGFPKPMGLGYVHYIPLTGFATSKGECLNISITN
jgi:hypothetical protein